MTVHNDAQPIHAKLTRRAIEMNYRLILRLVVSGSRHTTEIATSLTCNQEPIWSKSALKHLRRWLTDHSFSAKHSIQLLDFLIIRTNQRTMAS